MDVCVAATAAGLCGRSRSSGSRRRLSFFSAAAGALRAAPGPPSEIWRAARRGRRFARLPTISLSVPAAGRDFDRHLVGLELEDRLVALIASPTF
ncbi:hypothetical protein F2981_04605 [Sinorhizobium meliloti]|nr:hypothetical protein [Sinorhizobium meliloti]